MELYIRVFFFYIKLQVFYLEEALDGRQLFNFECKMFRNYITYTELVNVSLDLHILDKEGELI